MPSEEQTTNQQTSQVSDQPAPATPQITVPAPQDVSSTIVQPTLGTPASAPLATELKQSLASIMDDVAGKITESSNILIALSSDPSVDDLAAAIGFSLYLDRIGKRATAIYSGATPNALEFLKPEDTFESTADTLQDFVIALNKDKADHLRYKLDGDYVKIFITPYKKRIDEADLDYSYGDYNVDLVIAMDVNNGVDLDSALREYGRIMHDASVINVTTGNPGKFGEIEWSDKAASSVSEMVSDLLYERFTDNPPDKDEATALLTGIVAATDRFSKANTTPDTMQIASKLMESGADQQLIAKNITGNIDEELSQLSAEKAESDATASQKTEDEEPAEENLSEISIEHDKEEPEPESESSEVLVEEKSKETPVEEAKETTTKEPVADELAPAPEFGESETTLEPSATLSAEPESSASDATDSTLLADLKAAEASLAGAAAETTKEAGNEPVRIESSSPDEKVLTPSADFLSEESEESPNKYSEMLDAALAEATPAPEPVMANPAPVAAPEAELIPNPALSAAPVAPSAPEINGVPEMNYNATPNDELLPPPPTPPIEFGSPIPTDSVPMPTAMSTEATQPAIPTMPAMPAEPALTEQPAPVQPTDASSAFQIPGM